MSTSDEAAYDAAAVAILRMLERNGHDRKVLSELSPRDQQTVFAAERRHMDRVRGR